jgi:hypothetical protein
MLGDMRRMLAAEAALPVECIVELLRVFIAFPSVNMIVSLSAPKTARRGSHPAGQSENGFVAWWIGLAARGLRRRMTSLSWSTPGLAVAQWNLTFR